MMKCYENQILISGEDSEKFQKKMNYPDIETINRRDQNFDWITQHMDIQSTETGFTVTVDT